MRGGEVLHEAVLGLGDDGSPRHSTALLAEIERAVAASGGWEQVGRIAVGRGPGSFVGIRIGLATARGLAASTGLPVSGVCTLDALGRGMGGGLAVLDARRGEVFAALYSPGESASGSRWSQRPRPWPSACLRSPRRCGRRARGRYDFVKNWRIGRLTSPTTRTLCTGSLRGTFVPSQGPPGMGMAVPSIRST